jgi:hypothetical protein
MDILLAAQILQDLIVERDGLFAAGELAALRLQTGPLFEDAFVLAAYECGVRIQISGPEEYGILGFLHGYTLGENPGYPLTIDCTLTAA